MILPAPAFAYDQNDQAQTRAIIEREVGKLQGNPFEASTAVYAANLIAAKSFTYAASATLSNGQVIVVAGRNAINDGYGGTFVYDSSDTTTVFTGDGLGFVDNLSRRFRRIVANGECNVFWFGAKGDGVSDDSTPINQALASGLKTIRLPAGTYKCNATIAAAVFIKGDGPKATIVMPYSTALAAMTFTDTSVDWSYAMAIEGIEFKGVGRAGTGFTFGKTAPANYAVNDEFCGRVTFNNSLFHSLAKGIQRPFGNIGLYLNRCGFADCTYGSYHLNNKWGGGMHAGCLFVDGGETDACDCGHFIHNTQDGFGQVQFRGHVFESNFIALYGYHNTNTMISPFLLDGCWNEVNGPLCAGAPGTVTLDQWSGTVNTPAAFPVKAFIFDGDTVSVDIPGGFATGIRLKATNSIASVRALARFESKSGFSGDPCVVDTPATSRIDIGDHVCAVGGVAVNGMIMTGKQFRSQNTPGATNSPGGANLVPPRLLSISGLGFTKTSAPYTGTIGVGTGTTFSGTASFTADVVADGELFATCNEFVRTIASGAFEASDASSTTMAAGYWAHFVSIKITSGAVTANIWDRSTNHLASWAPISDGNWHTYAGISYIASGTPTAYLDFTDTLGASATVRLSAFNLVKFATLEKAMEFLQAKVFAA